jgi:hypothetical protein
VVFWKNKFYMLTMDPDDKITLLVSSNGTSWNATGWTFFTPYTWQTAHYTVPTVYYPDSSATQGQRMEGYEPTKPSVRFEDFRMSVVNGTLYITGYQWKRVYSVGPDGRYLRWRPSVSSFVWSSSVGGSWTKKELPATAGVVTGPSNYLVCGDNYSQNGGTSWTKHTGGYDYPQVYDVSSNSRSADYDTHGANAGVDQKWHMRRVSPAPSAIYYISQNRPDDKGHYHYTPTASQPGTRLASLGHYISAIGGQSGWRSFIGPPVGNHLYAMSGDLKLVKIDARYPTSASGPETLVEFDDVAHDGVTNQVFDFANSSSSIYRGGYQYGPLEQLDDQYLNGTYSPNSGPLIFCKDRVIAMFRTAVAPDNSPRYPYFSGPIRR